MNPELRVIENNYLGPLWTSWRTENPKIFEELLKKENWKKIENCFLKKRKQKQKHDSLVHENSETEQLTNSIKRPTRFYPPLFCFVCCIYLGYKFQTVNTFFLPLPTSYQLPTTKDGRISLLQPLLD